MTSSPPAAPPAVLGVQAPRLHSLPAGVVTTAAGDDAVDLAAAAGLHLDPWQAQALRDVLGERADGQWAAREAALVVPRQNGKGSVLEALELAALFLHRERLILHTAHEMKTAKNHYERMMSLIKGAPFLERQVAQWRNSNEEISITLHSGGKLRFIARSTGSGRGFTADRLVLDEAMILTPESLSALLFTLAVAPNPQTVYAASAGFTTSELLAQVRARGVEGRDPALAYLEWSAPDDADLDDPLAWAQANPALGIRLRPETVATERGMLPEVQFARERLGVWAATGGDPVIPLGSWQGLTDRASTLTEPAVLGVDVSPDRSLASIGAASLRAVDGRTHVEVLENRAGASWVVDRLVNLCAARRVTEVVIDQGSPASALAQSLEAAGVPLRLTGTRDMGAACGALYDAVMDGQLRHRGQQVLEAAVEAGRSRKLGDAWAWHRRSARADITPLVAVTLAHHAAHRAPRKGLTRVTGRASAY